MQIQPAFGKRIATTALVATMSLCAFAQDDEGRISFGLHFDPVVAWFRSDVNQTINKGARPGFNIGLTFDRYFTSNYAFSTGINIISAGGRLLSTDTLLMQYNNFTEVVNPGVPVVYKIQYLSIPVGLKLQTNEIGYVKVFTNIGLDPKFVIGGKNDIPQLDIKNESAGKELKKINIGWHITGGIEYSLGGSTSLQVGLNYENNFLDITKDNGKQPRDKVTHKMLGLRLGLNF
ncbi:MAG TPA: porin family protein [Bacteroidales bacterium]|nr:porin family protein [Bacteroidales bacterium]